MHFMTSKYSADEKSKALVIHSTEECTLSLSLSLSLSVSLCALHTPAFCDLLSCDLLSNASITLELKAVVALQSSVKADGFSLDTSCSYLLISHIISHDDH